MITASRTVSHGDTTWRAISSTRGCDTVYVLVHGLGVSHRYFARLHRELAVDSDVHSIDLPGFGGLPKPHVSPTVEQMAIVLADALDELRLTDVVLVGQSMGAQWVVELAAQRPELASRVVTIGPVTDDRRRSLLAQSMKLALDTFREPIDTNALILVDYIRCGSVWFLRQALQMIPYPIEDRVADLTMPFLAIRGSDDPIAGAEWTRELARRARDGRSVTIPGHPHNAQYSAPKSVAGAIREFVARPSST